MDDAELEALRLNREDIERVAEFFDCDVDAAFDFVRKIWLPDARVTTARLCNAITARDWRSVIYLCDKLREGARCVGATRIMQYASDIERATADQRWWSLCKYAMRLQSAIDTLASLLLDPVDSLAASKILARVSVQ